ncbi:AAA family ATPase [Pectinatus frisingensis]|uniref:AAA family ATPase n=1 Tax=Pectinatus frisingensis TaxID=865 RepID=UPI0018C4A290|nr:AAA family ATPase [Pectinatus frisingensis]
MKILGISCDNFYMFKDFNLDFTYKKKVTHPLSKYDVLFQKSKINVRNNIVIMGENASGKTTFGKLLCLICNYLCGRDVGTGEDYNLKTAQYNKKTSSYFTIEFEIDRIAYYLKAKFNEDGLIEEELYKHKIYRSYNIDTLRNKLHNTKPVYQYGILDKVVIDVGFQSYIMRLNEQEIKNIINKICYLFSFSDFISDSSIINKLTMDISLLNNILPKIDNSVEKVVKLKSASGKVSTQSYMIIFKNKDQVTVPDGELKKAVDRLSHGTFESVAFTAVLSRLAQSGGSSIMYIDENLAHMHAELEAYFIRKALLINNNKNQLFFTTHNIQIFDLNIPNNAFLFFKRNSKGNNIAIYASEKFNKNDRNIRSYYENDFFGVIPDYSDMDEIFEEKINGN